MAITLDLFIFTTILLAFVWPIIVMFDARRRPIYTFADWRKTGVRICSGIQRLHAGGCPYSSCGCSFNHRACHLLLQDLLANTAFIVNLVLINDRCWPSVLGSCQHPEINSWTC